MATSAKGNGAAPEEKLEWLFDHVYDKVIREFLLSTFEFIICHQKQVKCRKFNYKSFLLQKKMGAASIDVRITHVENTQDQSGRLNLSEVEGILSTLITMENVDVEECSQKEIILDIFRLFRAFQTFSKDLFKFTT